MNADEIIIEPVVTEKTNVMREGENRKYVFRINAQANKSQVMRAVKELFDVKPLKCGIMNVKPKPRMARTKSGRRHGSTASWKKAIVTLASGEKISIFEGA